MRHLNHCLISGFDSEKKKSPHPLHSFSSLVDKQALSRMPPNKKHLLKSLTYLDYSKADRVQEGWNIEGGKVCKHAADCQNIHCGSTAEPCGTWSLKETETADRKAWRTSKFLVGVPCEQRSGTLRGKEWPPTFLVLMRTAGIVAKDLNTSLAPCL